MTKPEFHFLFVSAPFGGTEVFVKNLQQAISGRPDIKTTWISIEWNPPELLARIPPISLNWTAKAGYVAHQRILRLQQSGARFDAAFFGHLTPLLALRAFRKTVPTLLSIDVTPIGLEPFRTAYAPHASNRLRQFTHDVRRDIAKGVYNDVVRLLPWSAHVRKSLIEDYAIPREKIDVIPPGIDTTRWRIGLNGSAGDSPVRCGNTVLFVGGDFQRKGGDLLLRIARRPEFRHTQFHVVTRSFTGDRPGNVVVYDSIEANSEALIGLYRQADVFVLPTRADLYPTMSICEAMAMELPVIATAVGGLDLAVHHEENGFIVPVDDEDALAARLSMLMNDSGLRVQMGRAGRERAETDFDIRKNAGVIVELLKSAARRERSECV